MEDPCSTELVRINDNFGSLGQYIKIVKHMQQGKNTWSIYWSKLQEGQDCLISTFERRATGYV